MNIDVENYDGKILKIKEEFGCWKAFFFDKEPPKSACELIAKAAETDAHFDTANYMPKGAEPRYCVRLCFAADTSNPYNAWIDLDAHLDMIAQLEKKASQQ